MHNFTFDKAAKMSFHSSGKYCKRKGQNAH